VNGFCYLVNITPNEKSEITQLNPLFFSPVSLTTVSRCSVYMYCTHM